jgi:hypothetical protein
MNTLQVYQAQEGEWTFLPNHLPSGNQKRFLARARFVGEIGRYLH